VRSAAEIAALLVKRQREFGPHLRADFRHYSAPTNCAAVALFRHCSHVPFDERPVAGNQVMAAGSGGGNASKSTYPRSRSIAMRCASITRSSSGVASAGTPSSSSLLSMCLTALSRGWRYGPPIQPTGPPHERICAPRPRAHWLCDRSAPANKIAHHGFDNVQRISGLQNGVVTKQPFRLAPQRLYVFAGKSLVSRL
jgi:hypothetical protein